MTSNFYGTTTFISHSLLSPQGVAVIGTSTNPIKLGYSLARNLVLSNFQGMVHFVNPKGGSLFGRSMYAHICEVPDPVDLAILLIAVTEILIRIAQLAADFPELAEIEIYPLHILPQGEGAYAVDMRGKLQNNSLTE